MITSTNFSSVTLLGGVDIIVFVDNAPFVFHIPTLKEGLGDKHKIFESVCITSLEMLTENMQGHKFIPSTKLEFLTMFLKSGDSTVPKILASLYAYIRDFKFHKGKLFCGEKEITSEVFDIFCDYVGVGGGYIKISDLENREQERVRLAARSPEEVEWDRQMAVYKAKIQKTKAKAGAAPKLDTIISAVVHEFKMSIGEVFDMNPYTLYFFYEKVFKIANYNISTIAMGNGLIDAKKSKNKHKHWTEV